MEEYVYEPSSDWAYAGPIIEEFEITLIHGSEGWTSCETIGTKEKAPPPVTVMTASDQLVAAMRTFVAMHFGQFVDRESILH